MQLINIILGASLLLGGRKLFFFFIAAAGFMVGLQIGARVAPSPWWIGVIVALVFAVGAALIAVFLKTIAIGVAGFLMGGYVLGSVGGLVGMDQGLAYWGLFLVGGVAGVILITIFFSLTLIWLSSVAGTLLIAELIPWEGITRILISVAILFIGVIFQTSMWGGDNDED
jgi:hypothetical protein